MILFKENPFKDQKSLFKYLKDNESDIIQMKQNEVYKSIEKGAGIYNTQIVPKNGTNKESFEAGYLYPVINSTHWLDSHDDVHLKGCYKKTVKEQQGKVYYIDSHLKGVSNIIVKRQYIEMFADEVDWKLLGKNIEGSTEGLLFKFKEEHVKPEYLQIIKEDKELQNSFAMRYVKLSFACSSTDSAFKENKEVWDAVLDTIANKEQAQKKGYFYAVQELSIIGEGSLCPVIGGSNSATSIVQVEPLKNTQKEAVNTDTSKGKSKIYYI